MKNMKNAQALIENVSRRGLLKGIAATGSFIIAAQFMSFEALADMHYETGAGAMPHGVVTDPHVFVSIDKDGTVNIVAARAEMGTRAARTTLPMILAAAQGLNLRNVRMTLWVDGRKLASEFGEAEFTGQGLDGPIVLKLSRRIVDGLAAGRKIEVTLDLKPALEGCPFLQTRTFNLLHPNRLGSI